MRLRLRNPCKKCIVKVMCERGCRSHYEHINTWFEIRNCFKYIFSKETFYSVIFACLVSACGMFIIFCILILVKGGTL